MKEQRAEVKLAFVAPEGLTEGHPQRPDVQVEKAPGAGDLCPRCQVERLDYDGLLNLACSRCGYALVGCFT